MSGPLLLPTWGQLAGRPEIVATMRRYLEQIACVLRPGSVTGADLALRSFAAFLVQTAPEVTSVTQVTRRHIEDYKPWLAKRPGQTRARLTTATLAHRLGTLRMFFVRIDEWGWEQAPTRVPMFPGDLPRQDHPLPRRSTTPPPQSCSALRTTTTVSWSGSPSRCCSALACGSVSSRRCRRTLLSRSAPAPGCTSRSASSARTATCRCTLTCF